VRVPTARLNTVVRQITTQRGPSHKAGTKPPKILYVSQITTCPPTIVFFVNDVRSFDRSYQRYIVNQLRRHLPYAEVPIRVLFRSRRQHEGTRGVGGHIAEAAEAIEAAKAIEAAEAIEAEDMDLSRRDGDERVGRDEHADRDEHAVREIPSDEPPTVPDDRPSHPGGDRKRRIPSRAARYAKSGKAPRGGKAGKAHGGPAKPGAGKFKAGKARAGKFARGGKPRPPGARPKGKGGSPKPAGPAGPRTSGGPKGQGPKGRGPKGGGPKGPKGPRGPRKRRP